MKAMYYLFEFVLYCLFGTFMRGELIYITLKPEEGENSQVKKIKDLRPTLFDFKTSKVIYEQIYTGLEKGMRLIAYADVNNDKYIDLIVYKKDTEKQNTFSFYAIYYNISATFFEKRNNSFLFNLTLNNKTIKHISNCFPTVLFPGSNLSYIVSVKTYEEEEISIVFVPDPNEPSKFKELVQYESNIVIFPIKANRSMSIIYNSKTTTETTKMVDVFFNNSSTFAFSSLKFEQFLHQEGGEFSKSNVNLNNIILNKGNAFIDIDADCVNDLLYMTKRTNDSSETIIFETYRGFKNEEKKEIEYVFKQVEMKEEKEYGSFVIGDFNDNGYVDLLFPINNSSYIDILKNSHNPDFDWTENFCKNHTRKISEKIPETFDFTNKKSFNLLENLNNETLKDAVFYDGGGITSTLVRVGDFKSSAFPGLLATFKKDKFTFVAMISNLNFNFTIDAIIEAPEGEEILYASFFDFGESGNLGVLITTNERVYGVYNKYIPDAYFIKAQTLLEERKYYSLEVGTNYRYIATYNNGTRRQDFAWQLAQTGDLNLNLPYALAGIGRSNNYIENFRVISSNYDKAENQKNDDTENFTPIIPKTQLLITKKNEKSQVTWSVDLIVSPIETLIYLIIVVAVVLIVILIIIIILHVREVNEDKKQEGEIMKVWFA